MMTSVWKHLSAHLRKLAPLMDAHKIAPPVCTIAYSVSVRCQDDECAFATTCAGSRNWLAAALGTGIAVRQQFRLLSRLTRRESSSKASRHVFAI